MKLNEKPKMENILEQGELELVCRAVHAFQLLQIKDELLNIVTGG